MSRSANVAHESERLYAHACRVIPGGVNSPVRSWKAVGGQPLFLQRGRAAEVVDADGRAYLDFLGSWGALILGHAPPRVSAAIAQQAKVGTSFGAPTGGEVELAQHLVGALPSVEQVRLVNSGTEATMSALRLARAATGREAVLKFAGCYHGHVDALLVRAGSGALTLGVPDSPGVPPSVTALTWTAEFNDVAGVRDFLRARAGELAAVIVEPVAGNMGVVAPAPGFLEMLREETSRAHCLLVFDEVITGFRVGWGGAQGRYGVTPDLTCLGKVIGGGLPLAAFGGRRDLMEQLAPRGAVYQAGTLSGNPLAVAAGLATLNTLRQTPGAYDRLEQLGARAEEVLGQALAATRPPACVNRVGSMLTLFFGVERVRDYGDVRRADTAAFARFFHGMLAEGVYLPPSQFEAMFLSLAHTEADIDRLGRAARTVLAGR
ncbi:MAG: glutamate-1-semialdehyde-2,1-aminomutase [Deltaproteobacteria bacterium]|nr:MAG: glutamate-1-semialdehyde-2,1-aminomutase [Deltaproteobacteria bacterium]